MMPIRDVALCVEMGERPVVALMAPSDWEEQIDRVLRGHEGTAPWPLVVPMATRR